MNIENKTPANITHFTVYIQCIIHLPAGFSIRTASHVRGLPSPTLLTASTLNWYFLPLVKSKALMLVVFLSVLPTVTHCVPSSVASMTYPVTGDPPSEDGVCHSNNALLASMSLTFNGPLGDPGVSVIHDLCHMLRSKHILL